MLIDFNAFCKIVAEEPLNKVIEALIKIGVDPYNSDYSFKSMEEILLEISFKWKESTNERK